MAEEAEKWEKVGIYGTEGDWVWQKHRKTGAMRIYDTVNKRVIGSSEKKE